MYDPNDVIEVEIEGVGKVKTRLMTERHLKQFNRNTESPEGEKLTLEAHHEKLNKALAPYLVDSPEDFTLVQKIQIVNNLPWAIVTGELERLKKAVPSPSESPTS